ncbi:uncharacterized protein L969DRAFT_102588 [Mixia osmundae IAM 14324]|uniref:Acireductone dioxygenase n=1 Tax=Mixia osmundae (strain CBS 9802 / IAM 14324 / JCM 22182 / KY 12970) TaxID=764103 RepID=G7E995_MIXOS|nr:uncharacterized protein L969DRAFT_102588 [Mixia osmundae IAM 14324]KEI39837.1 hypothetical protein L969DRAFT_102588 [Mixia osmundae IAM 14324]GAA99214.1 hypothetical protein E5Q_05907 [Mixia osmundae IAM 14324]
MDLRTIGATAGEYPIPKGVIYQYGTAGFRMRADVLEPVLFRVGILAALRSQRLDGKSVGVMITASHNPEQDNGVKIVDPRGEMLESSWEQHATLIANAATTDDLVTLLEDLAQTEKINTSRPARVVYGHDTRPSCPALLKALEDGLQTMNAKKVTQGLLTTPQLHYLVRAYNTMGTPQSYGTPTEAGYYKKISDAFKTLVHGKPPLSTLTVDCANGVGAPKLKALLEHIGDSNLSIRITKDEIDTKGALNNSCGADYVKTQQKAPPGMNIASLDRYCSFDGDADRIVYYYQDQDGQFRLLDGDKIAGLAAMFILDLVKRAGLETQVGVVQTAYANGSSTAYLTKVLKVPVSCVATGVKYLHHAAERYDIGVYFEANGHGTVLFSDDALQAFKTKEPSTPNQQSALAQLAALSEMINQTVGDALSDMLLVEAILLHRQWGPAEWDQAYSDLPNRLVKVTVEDRNAFKTADAERKLTSPRGLQEKLDALVAKYQLGRVFVRPSGTEECVRVYAEASTRAETDELAFKAAGLVFNEAGQVPHRGRIVEARKMKAWIFDEESYEAQPDPTLPHHSGRAVPLDVLAKLGLVPLTSQKQDQVDKLASERGYKHRDEIHVSRAGLGDQYDAKIKMFYAQHLHEDEEIRYIKDGQGYFDVRDGQDQAWIRILVEPEDFIVLPAGIYHRFTLDESKDIKAMRLFRDEPKWTPHNRDSSTDQNPYRKQYLAEVLGKETV